MIPNYRDSLPRNLSTEIAFFAKAKQTVFVPGHGPVGGNRDMILYKDFLDFVENKAKEYFDAGKSAEQAAREFKLSNKFKDWLIFSNAVVPRALAAWYRVFENEK